MSYRNYGSWNTGYSSSVSSKPPADSPPAPKKYESTYTRTKSDSATAKDNTRSTPSADKSPPTPSRYSSTSASSYRNNYTPSASTYSRDKSGTREKDSSLTTLTNRYANYTPDEKPDKQSVLSKYMNAKAAEKKTDPISPSTTYTRAGASSVGRPRSRDPSPVDKSYSYSRGLTSTQSRNNDDNSANTSSRSKALTTTKDKARDLTNSERDKDIPSKTTKSPGYSSSAYPSYKLYPRTTAYSRSLSKEEPKVEPVSSSRYNPTTNRFSSSYTRPIVDKPVSPYLAPISPCPITTSSNNSLRSISQLNGNSNENIVEEPKNEIIENSKDETSSEDESDDSDEDSSESEAQSMISLTVVTRGTSPTAPCSSVYLRTRRADMAKTIEKTVTRPKRRVVMVDKEMQSDRMDDSTRSSRYGSTARISASPWSSYSDSRYTPITSGRYSSGRYSTYTSTRDTSSTATSDKTPSSNDSASRRAESLDTSASTTQTDNLKPKLSDSSENKSEYNSKSISNVEPPAVSSFKSEKEVIKESLPRSIPVREKSKSKTPPLALTKVISKQPSPEINSCNDQLPPQVPKSESVPLTKSASITQSLIKTGKTVKKTVKKVRAKDGETKKRLVKRSVSTSSGDSECSLQNGSTESGDQENSAEPAGIKKSKSLSRTKSIGSVSKLKNISETKVSPPSNISNEGPNNNNNSKSVSRISLSRTSSSTESNSVPTCSSSSDEESEGSKSKICQSQTINNGYKQSGSSRTSVLVSSADEVSLSQDKPAKPPPSPRSLKSDSQPRTEEAKSFLMRALAPVTNLFKMRSQETNEKGQWVDNAGDSDNQNTMNVISIATDSEGKQSSGLKPLPIRHIESGEKAWWMESNSDKNSEGSLKKSSSISFAKNVDSGESKNSDDPKNTAFRFKLARYESGEKAWWLQSNGNIPEGVEVRTPSRKGSSDSEHSDKFNVYKIRHIDSGEGDWSQKSKETTQNSSEPEKPAKTPEKSTADDNFTLNVVRIRHIESGEKAWWMASNKNIPEGIKILPVSSDDSDSDSSSETEDNKININGGTKITSNGVTEVSRFPTNLPDEEYEEPLGDRRSPEGLETPHAGEDCMERTSPYDNIICNHTPNQTGKNKIAGKSLPNFISRHMDIDDILGTSGQLFTPMMDRILARKTGREIVEGDNSECKEIDVDQVRIHDSTAQRPVIQKLLNRSDIIDCRNENDPVQLDDSALQVFKDGDYGPYLDLESSLSEQQEELEGFHANRKNSLILRTQLSVRVHAIIEKLLNSTGRDLRRALFSLKQIFQEDKDLVHEFVQNDGLDCLVRVGADADQNYQNYILRALGQVMLYVDGMNGVMGHSASLQWLYSLIASKFRLVVKTTLKLLLVFVEYVDTNCLLLIKAIETVDCSQGLPPWTNIMNLLKDYDASDTELLIYAMTLINKCLNGISDQDTYYNQTDGLEEQGMCDIIQRYMSRQGTDLDLLRQFQIYEAVLSHEDGDDIGTPLRQLDDTIRRTLRHRKPTGESGARKSRRHSTGTAPTWGDVGGAARYNQALLRNALADAGEDEPSPPPTAEVFRDSKEVSTALQRRRDRIQRQRDLVREQDLWSLKQKEIPKTDNSVSLSTNGNQMYTSALQSRIQNGSLGHSGSKDLVNDVNVIQRQLNNMDINDNKGDKAQWKKLFPNRESAETNGDESAPVLVLNKIKDITEKLCSPTINSKNQVEEKQLSLGEEMTGVILKAKKGLEKSKSIKNIIRVPAVEIQAKETKISETDFTWETIIASMNRPLRLNDLDFSDLNENYVDNSAPSPDTGGNIPPPPPPLKPPPPFIDLTSGQMPPPPPNYRRFSNSTCSGDESGINGPSKTKKTIKLFWREIMPSKALESTTIWDEIVPVKVDANILEHLFESRTKDPIKQQLENIKIKEVIVLDHKRSNAINISLKKLPNPHSIKNAILKMDSTVLNREGIDKLLNMLPSEEETVLIQEAQMANPSIPLGNAEQFLLTLSSISALNARLHLWVFKLDFESIENEIAEHLMDVKLAMEIIKKNTTFKRVLSTVLSIGSFLNSCDAKGFQIDYLSKINEVKDTLQRNSLLYHLCNIMMDAFPDSSDLYSEIGPVTRAAKVNYEEIVGNIERLERDCKTSMGHLKQVVKHDGNVNKAKIGDFLHDCAERIILLGMIKKRINFRYENFLLWLGISPSQMHEKRPSDVFNVISEFALEYRTTRERVIEQRARKACHRERNKTRGKLITDIIRSPPSADSQLKLILNSETSSNQALGRKRKDPEFTKEKKNAGEKYEGIEEVFNDLLSSKTSDYHPVKRHTKRTSVKRSRTREGIHKEL